jgi:hypothetical protein
VYLRLLLCIAFGFVKRSQGQTCGLFFVLGSLRGAKHGQGKSGTPHGAMGEAAERIFCSERPQSGRQKREKK